ncbi:MAG: class F420-dependent oxidoreductase [Ilumatobacteraceae bacterium]|nr:class F420-dependent oxidoreductase [Ilumatobacteraceae bacterium]
MKVGIHFYVTGYTIDPVTIAKAVESMGFDSFWVPDHAILPANSGVVFPMTGGEIPPLYGEMADPFVLMSFLAAATTTLKVAAGVCIVPERHPLTFAKSVSTLDNFSNGRLIMGIGVGWMREEIELFGVDFDTRWTYTRETIEFCRILWRDGVGSYQGTLLKFPEVICDPIPAQRPAGPPIVLGGLPSDVTYRRLARWGDGWLAALATPEQVVAARKGIAVECEKLGRDPSEIEISVMTLEADPALQEEYAAAGADRLVVAMYNHPGTYVAPDQWAEVTGQAATTGPPTAGHTMNALEQVRSRAGLC